MTQRRICIILFLTLILGLLAAACTSEQGEQQPDPEQVAVIVALTQTAAALEISEAPGEIASTPIEVSGIISGQAYGFAPPTPPLVIYAVDNATGEWASVETPQTDGQTAFTLKVRPGLYQVFACPLDLENCAFGYSEDGWALSNVNVAAGQTVSDILVHPPGMGDCGPRMRFPASPDGRFQAVEPLTEECPDSTGELKPLSQEACVELASAAESTLGVPFNTTTVAIERSLSEQIGTACQLAGQGDGNDFDGVMPAFESLKAMMLARGWIEQIAAPMCLGEGGFGPGAFDTCYSQGDQVCEVFVSADPVDMVLCDGIEGPIGACMAALEPEQKIYKVLLTCAGGFEFITTSGDDLEPQRVGFSAGEMSAQLSGRLAPDEVDRYVLTAMQGQQLNAYLYPSGPASLAIWGADGAVLISDHADATDWFGSLPLTQDYFIDIKSLDENDIDYTLDIVIPPLPEMGLVSGKLCFPSEGIPAMTVYFEDTMNGLVTELPIADGQGTYQVELEPGTYLAYAWLPDFSLGGLFSEAVPCGLSVDCSNHEAIAFQVNPGETTSGIDICDWYLDPAMVPRP